MAEWSREVFAINLRYYLERSGKTQKELAEIIGVSSPTMHDWINGKKYPRIDKVEKLADYFGILKSDLIEDKQKKPATNDGLSEAQIALIEFAKSVPADKAALVLRTMKAILADD